MGLGVVQGSLGSGCLAFYALWQPLRESFLVGVGSLINAPSIEHAYGKASVSWFAVSCWLATCDSARCDALNTLQWGKEAVGCHFKSSAAEHLN